MLLGLWRTGLDSTGGLPVRVSVLAISRLGSQFVVCSLPESFCDRYTLADLPMTQIRTGRMLWRVVVSQNSLPAPISLKWLCGSRKRFNKGTPIRSMGQRPFIGVLQNWSSERGQIISKKSMRGFACTRPAQRPIPLVESIPSKGVEKLRNQIEAKLPIDEQTPIDQ